MSKREDTEERAEIRRLEKQIDRNYYTRPLWARKAEAIARKSGLLTSKLCSNCGQTVSPSYRTCPFCAKSLLETLKSNAERADPETD